MTALMFAVKVGSFDVIKLLVENGANLFAKNSVSYVHYHYIIHFIIKIFFHALEL